MFEQAEMMEREISFSSLLRLKGLMGNTARGASGALGSFLLPFFFRPVSDQGSCSQDRG